MKIYKRGYEKGIKEIKKDLLVLKFVNKTKTNLLRRYTEKMESANKIIDAADLRPQLRLYLQHNFGKTTQSPSDGIYLRNQLKSLTDQDSLLNTAELCDFFLKVICMRENQKQHDIRKVDDLYKRLQGRHVILTNTMEKHRNNVNSLPMLINSIIEDFIVHNERDKSQEHSINRELSGKSNKSRYIFLTAGQQDEKRLEDFFVHDFTTELYSQLDDDQRKELLVKLVSNKMLLFHFREYLLTKLEPHNITGPSLIRGARPRAVSTRLRESSKSNNDNSQYSRSKSRTEKAEQNSARRLGPQNKASFGLPNVSRRDMSREHSANSRLNLTADNIAIRADQTVRIVDESAEVPMDVLSNGKRKILRYMVKKTGIAGQGVKD